MTEIASNFNTTNQGNQPEKPRLATLQLDSGAAISGKLIGATTVASGEMVFTTGMVGYSEALTDPSYFGQILVFAYPLIGNYGIPKLEFDELGLLPHGFESPKIHASAVIMTVDSPAAFHWNSFQNLNRWLEEAGVPGLVGVDTRHLVHLIRGSKNLLGRIEPEVESVKMVGKRDYGGAWSQDQEFFDPGEQDILGEVIQDKRLQFKARTSNETAGKTKTPKIAVIDCGVKWNILRQLVELGCDVELIPWNDNLADVNCDGWLISNGPGDPQRSGNLVSQIRDHVLSATKPVLGICLGHQILSIAIGAETKRMPYGHRSHNQPVYQIGTRKGYITSQNHGFVVCDNNLPSEWEVWFRNVNDESIEGIRHKRDNMFSVQFHPEAAGGPRDSAWVLEKFVDLCK